MLCRGLASVLMRLARNLGTLTLTGASTNANTLAPSLANATGGDTSLTKTGLGTVSITAAATYNDATAIQSGGVSIDVANALPATTALTMGNNTVGSATGIATLNVANNQTVTSLTVLSDSAANNQIIIAPTKTLTITSTVAAGFTIGMNATAAGVLKTNLIASGGGSLVHTNNTASAVFAVGNQSSNTAGAGGAVNADFSGLNNFSVALNTTTGTVRIGAAAARSNHVAGTPAVLTLAANSTLTANLLSIGEGNIYNGVLAEIPSLKLGSGANALNFSTINIATGGRDAGSVTFAGATGTLTLRDAAGTGAANFNMGTGSGATGVGNQINAFDVRGHAADIQLAVTSIGTSPRSIAGFTNTFSFDQGTLVISSLTTGSSISPPSPSPPALLPTPPTSTTAQTSSRPPPACSLSPASTPTPATRW